MRRRKGRKRRKEREERRPEVKGNEKIAVSTTRRKKRSEWWDPVLMYVTGFVLPPLWYTSPHHNKILLALFCL